MSELESELRVLLDKQALYELVIRYVRGVDRNDREMVLACFHADAFLHYNTNQGSAVDFYEQLWAATESAAGGIPRGQHAVTNALFEVRGDVAYGESYLECRRAGIGAIHAGAESRVTGPGFPTTTALGTTDAPTAPPLALADRGPLSVDQPAPFPDVRLA